MPKDVPEFFEAFEFDKKIEEAKQSKENSSGYRAQQMREKMARQPQVTVGRRTQETLVRQAQATTVRQTQTIVVRQMLVTVARQTQENLVWQMQEDRGAAKRGILRRG